MSAPAEIGFDSTSSSAVGLERDYFKFSSSPGRMFAT